MSTRSRRAGMGRSREVSGDVALYVALALIAVTALGLAYLALSGVHLGSRPVSAPIPDSSPISTPTVTPTPTPAATAVAFIGAGSATWWTQSVGAGSVPGIISTQPTVGDGVTIAGLTAQLDEVVTSPGQQIVVQIGFQDIIEGASSAQINAAIQVLWQGVKDRGSQPIAALLPPSNSFPESVIAVNDLIKVSAATQGIAVLDVTTPVASVDGTWVAGYTDDGLQPNASGAAVMAQAVTAQLPGLVTSAPIVG